MKKYLFAIIFLIVALPSIAQKSKTVNQDVLSANIKKLMEHCQKHEMFNGNILVTQNGKAFYTNSIGLADRANKKELNDDTAFYLASVSKQFTAMAVMILKEQGVISYNDKLSKYFSQFPDYADDVTIRHMLTHTSGIPDHYGLGAYKPGLSNSDVFDLLIKQEELDFVPGEKYSYSNGAYVLLSMIVAKASGLTFDHFMYKNIFGRLGMKRTLVYTKETESISNRAIGYNSNGDLDDYTIYTTGAGGMYSTVLDLHTWDQALYTETLVSSKTLKEAFQPTKLNNGEFSDYGFGWGIDSFNERASVSHSGGLAGYSTYFKRNIYENSGYILLTNFGDASNVRGITKALDQILKNEPFDLPKIKISKKLAELIAEKPLAKAIDYARSLALSNSKLYEIDEQGINALGYKFMTGRPEYEKAIAVFNFNVEFNPNSSNVYDSLGEAQLASGDKSNGISNYSKSYMLNKNNTNALETLIKIGYDVSKLTKEVDLDIDVLESYVGSYKFKEINLVIDVIRKDAQLFVHPNGQSESEIFHSSQNRFYSKIVNAQISFNKGKDGKIASVTLHQNGDHLGVRIK